MNCPDGGRCHHDCPVDPNLSDPPHGLPCFRVLYAGPLSAAEYPDDTWPQDLQIDHLREALAKAQFALDDAPDPMAELAGLIEWLDAHLDEKVSPAYKAQPLAQDWARVAKVGEEAGEAVDALVGVTGQNPRKGTYGSMEDVLAELADVALTGLYAIQHFTKDKAETVEVLMTRARYHRSRVE